MSRDQTLIVNLLNNSYFKFFRSNIVPLVFQKILHDDEIAWIHQCRKLLKFGGPLEKFQHFLIAKIEFLWRALNFTPFSTTYAWIDISL